MYDKKVLFEDFLCFCASFLVLQEPFEMLGFIRESREWYFDKFDFKISQFNSTNFFHQTKWDVAVTMNFVSRYHNI